MNAITLCEGNISKIVLLDKATKKEVKNLGEFLPEEVAENICEQWGWNYCDEQGKSYWMEVVPQQLDKEMEVKLPS